MTLSEFTNIWTRKNRMIAICDYDDYDDMFIVVDEIEANKKSLNDIREYIIFTYCPYYSQYKDSYYLDKKWSEAEVEDFYIGDCFVIIWVGMKKGGMI